MRRKQSSRSSGHVFSHPLYQMVEDNLLDRLHDIKRSFKNILIIGACSPSFQDRIRDHFQTDITTTDLWNPTACVKTSYETLPFKPHSFDLIFNLSTLHWTNDIPGFLRQVFYLLVSDGLYLGAFVGGNSLNELSQALIEAEDLCRGSISMRISPFVKSSQAGALLQRAGFALPVCDIDTYTLNYATFKDIITDLRRLGETSAFKEPPPPLTKKIYKKAEEIYHHKFSDDQGKLVVTTDILYLTGWAPHPSQQQPLLPGTGRVSLLNLFSDI